MKMVKAIVKPERFEFVKKALEDLVSLEVLVAHRSTSTTGYSYTSDDRVISKIKKFLSKPS